MWDNDLTAKTGVGTLVSTGSWTPYYAQYVVEAATYAEEYDGNYYGIFQQIARFTDVDFGDAEVELWNGTEYTSDYLYTQGSYKLFDISYISQFCGNDLCSSPGINTDQNYESENCGYYDQYGCPQDSHVTSEYQWSYLYN